MCLPARAIHKVVLLSLRGVHNHEVVHFADDQDFVQQERLLVALDHDLQSHHRVGLLDLLVSKRASGAEILERLLYFGLDAVEQRLDETLLAFGEHVSDKKFILSDQDSLRHISQVERLSFALVYLNAEPHRGHISRVENQCLLVDGIRAIDLDFCNFLEKPICDVVL